MRGFSWFLVGFVFFEFFRLVFEGFGLVLGRGFGWFSLVLAWVFAGFGRVFGGFQRLSRVSVCFRGFSVILVGVGGFRRFSKNRYSKVAFASRRLHWGRAPPSFQRHV